MIENRPFYKNFYYTLFFAALLITGIGLANLNSATISLGQTDFSKIFISQLIYTFMGVGAMIVISFFKAKHFYKFAGWAYLGALASLVLVLVIGSQFKGSQSWIDLGVVRVQPSEFAKLGFILYLARYFAHQNYDGALGLRELIKPTIIFLIPVGLIILQGDLGTSLFFGFIFFSMVIIQGVRWRLLLVTILLVGGLSVFSYFFLLKPYQQARIVSFMNPELDSRGSGYHLVQSKIAVGSGGVFGQGYMKGESNKLKYLPERHTDFVFPVLAQEWGFVGSACVLALYFSFLLLGFRVCSNVNLKFSFFLSLGIVSLFFWHLVINLGGVLGLIPLTGVPLPLFSYGGSALITTWLGIGILNGIYRDKAA